MTAKEYKKTIDEMLADGMNYPEGSFGYIIWQNRKRLVEEFASQLCREQREICAKKADIEYHYGNAFVNRELIRNAKMPEI